MHAIYCLAVIFELVLMLLISKPSALPRPRGCAALIGDDMISRAITRLSPNETQTQDSAFIDELFSQTQRERDTFEDRIHANTELVQAMPDSMAY